MASLILTVLFGLIIAFFATQNTGSVSLNFLHYTAPGVPLYVIVIGALLVGLFLSWINGMISGIATGITMRGKETKIKDSKKENVDLAKRIHELELENAKLSASKNGPADDKSL